MTGQSVFDALNRISKLRKLPASITVDCGMEFISLVMDDWEHINHVSFAFTRFGKPTDHGLCESFNGRLRDEYLNVHEVKSIEDAKRIIEAWRCNYNEERPHVSLGNLTSNE